MSSLGHVEYLCTEKRPVIPASFYVAQISWKTTNKELTNFYAFENRWSCFQPQQMSLQLTQAGIWDVDPFMKIYRVDSRMLKLAKVNWQVVVSISVNCRSLSDCNLYTNRWVFLSGDGRFPLPACKKEIWEKRSFLEVWCRLFSNQPLLIEHTRRATVAKEGMTVRNSFFFFTFMEILFIKTKFIGFVNEMNCFDFVLAMYSIAR